MRLKTKSTEIWLQLGNGAEVLARPVPMSKAMEILDKHTHVEQVRGVGQVERRDFTAINRETVQYKIRDWRGMTDDDGNPYPFSKEHLLDIIENDQEFLAMVDAELEKQVKARADKAEESIKN